MLKHPEEANGYENGMDYKRIFRTCAHGFERIHGSAKEKDRNHDGTDITIDEYMDRDQDLLLVNSIWREKISIVNFRIMFQRSFLSLAAFFRFWGWVTRVETWVFPCHTLLHFNLQARHGGRARWIRSWIVSALLLQPEGWRLCHQFQMSKTVVFLIGWSSIFSKHNTTPISYKSVISLGPLATIEQGNSPPLAANWACDAKATEVELVVSKHLGDAKSQTFWGSPDPRCFGCSVNLQFGWILYWVWFWSPRLSARAMLIPQRCRGFASICDIHIGYDPPCLLAPTPKSDVVTVWIKTQLY